MGRLGERIEPALSFRMLVSVTIPLAVLSGGFAAV